jgi:isoleucyl-tRNA synthetase
LVDFCNEDLSAFYFDIRKDSLYCDAADDPKRMACRTVLDTLFHALVRYAAPVLVFTSEEVWGTRFPEAGSVHLLEWPVLPTLFRHPGEGRGPTDLAATTQSQLDPGLRRDDELVGKWELVRIVRTQITESIEPLRRDKTVGSSLEANVILSADYEIERLLAEVDMAEVAICASVTALDHEALELTYPDLLLRRFAQSGTHIGVTRTAHHKCGRCWRHLPEVTEDGALCSRCDQVVAGMDATAHV